MNIPTIEELDKIGLSAEGEIGCDDPLTNRDYRYLTAIRDAVVAACRPQLRPFAEMPEEVPDGCVRHYLDQDNNVWYFTKGYYPRCTHYIDIALPSPAYPADFEQDFAESGLDAKDKDAAFKLWKGGWR